jgi:hypothetical protein
MTTQQQAVKNGAPARTKPPTLTEELEAKVALLDWWRAEQAEQIKRLAAAIAALLAQQQVPNIQQSIQQGILANLLGNAPR